MHYQCQSLTRPMIIFMMHQGNQINQLQKLRLLSVGKIYWMQQLWEWPLSLVLSWNLDLPVNGVQIALCNCLTKSCSELVILLFGFVSIKFTSNNLNKGMSNKLKVDLASKTCQLKKWKNRGMLNKWNWLNKYINLKLFLKIAHQNKLQKNKNKNKKT